MTQLGHTDKVLEIAWSSDGKYIASYFWDGEIRVWDVVAGTMLMTYHRNLGWRSLFAWSPDGKRIAVGSGETVQIWDATTCTQLMAYEGHSDWVNAIAWSPCDGRIASCSDASVQVWDATTGVQLVTYQEHRNNYIWLQ